jgi:hypothetical protein
VLNCDHGIRVFGIGSNGDVWYASQNVPEVGWSSWNNLTGQSIQPGFAAAQNLNGLVQLVGVGTNTSSVLFWFFTTAGLPPARTPPVQPVQSAGVLFVVLCVLLMMVM